MAWARACEVLRDSLVHDRAEAPPTHTWMSGSPGPFRSSLLLCAAGMNVTQQLALVQRLAEVEAELQQAVQNLDGSPAARTRYQRARQAYQEVEDAALAVLHGQRQAA